VWGTSALLLALLGIRAWVVETGHATLGRTPVRVTVLTGACVLGTVLLAGLVALDGGSYLLWLLTHPDEARAIQEAAEAAADAAETAPPPTAPPPTAPPTAPPPPPGAPGN
jgi:hypothetical protein